MDTPSVSAAVAAHTPAPWTVYKETDEYPGIEGHTGTVIVWGDGEDDCGIRGDTHAERVANARLIAAAPDLYAALRGLVSALFAEGEDEDADDDEPARVRPDISAALVAAGEALTKARPR
jgi:hypothetical protein